MQVQQRKFGLFEYEVKDWKERGWPSKVNPDYLSWHSSNAYVTPLDSSFYYISIDDVNTSEKRQILADLGIRPALIITSSIDPETGEDNDQWTIKVPKLPQYCQELDLITHFARHLPKPVDDPAIRAIAQHLNNLTGDPDVKSCTRDFRLPGFYNLKKKYVKQGSFHIVSIKHAENTTCPVTEAMYYKNHTELSKTASRRARPVSHRADQQTLSAGTSEMSASRSISEPAGVDTPARSDPDFYPNNQIYMAHAREVQARDPSDPSLAPGRHKSKFRCLQRMCATGSLEGIDQDTELFQDVKRYIKDHSNLYIYLRTEAGIDDYHNDLPTVPASFDAHHQDALAFHGNHERAVKDAARRMFFMRHDRSVIERTLVEAGIETAGEIALWACSPTNAQIQSVAKRLPFWERIENKAMVCGATAGTSPKP